MTRPNRLWDNSICCQRIVVVYNCIAAIRRCGRTATRNHSPLEKASFQDRWRKSLQDESNDDDGDDGSDENQNPMLPKVFASRSLTIFTEQIHHGFEYSLLSSFYVHHNYWHPLTIAVQLVCVKSIAMTRRRFVGTAGADVPIPILIFFLSLSLVWSDNFSFLGGTLVAGWQPMYWDCTEILRRGAITSSKKFYFQILEFSISPKRTVLVLFIHLPARYTSKWNVQHTLPSKERLPFQAFLWILIFFRSGSKGKQVLARRVVYSR